MSPVSCNAHAEVHGKRSFLFNIVLNNFQAKRHHWIPPRPLHYVGRTIINITYCVMLIKQTNLPIKILKILIEGI